MSESEGASSRRLDIDDFIPPPRHIVVQDAKSEHASDEPLPAARGQKAVCACGEPSAPSHVAEGACGEGRRGVTWGSSPGAGAMSRGARQPEVAVALRSSAGRSPGVELQLAVTAAATSHAAGATAHLPSATAGTGALVWEPNPNPNPSPNPNPNPNPNPIPNPSPNPNPSP